MGIRVRAGPLSAGSRAGAGIPALHFFSPETLQKYIERRPVFNMARKRLNWQYIFFSDRLKSQ
jgi:hypothetical protein